MRWLSDHGDALYSYAMRRVHNLEAAEDLVQETLLAALACGDFAGRSSERTWLIGILKRKVVDYVRKAIRQRSLTELQSDGNLELFDKSGRWKARVSKWDCDPYEILENAEFQETLATCMSKLPPRIALVFRLRVGESVSANDLCKQLEISPANLWAILHRARQRLQRCLSANWFESGGK